MKFLVVHAHPDPASFNHELCASVLRGLRAAGHDVELLDLYAEGFEARMSTDERRSYELDPTPSDPLVQRSIELVTTSQGLVFVYPTWWFGPPAILKGWLERVLIPGVSFTLDPRTNRVRPGLGHVRRVVGVSTYGAPRWNVWLMSDGGRRLILRCVRILAPRLRCRSRWLGLYGMDGATHEQRAAFVERVETAMAKL